MNFCGGFDGERCTGDYSGPSERYPSYRRICSSTLAYVAATKPKMHGTTGRSVANTHNTTRSVIKSIIAVLLCDIEYTQSLQCTQYSYFYHLWLQLPMWKYLWLLVF